MWPRRPTSTSALNSSRALVDGVLKEIRAHINDGQSRVSSRNVRTKSASGRPTILANLTLADRSREQGVCYQDYVPVAIPIDDERHLGRWQGSKRNADTGKWRS